jgi:UDP-glucuronate 4-epimerase
VILVTGVAGFIGFHTARALLARGHTVAGVDDFNPYYDPALKRARIAALGEHAHFSLHEFDLADIRRTAELFDHVRPRHVVHLAAQAGVRYSLTNPHAYASANITAFLNVLEGCRNVAVGHLIYASSSSVYGANTSLPFSVADRVDHPVSLYAATKRANELMAHTYSHLFGIPSTGLRFFTVYGPWGRPDMAYYSFTRRILAGDPIDVFNFGQLERDFTFVDDIVEGIVRLLDRRPAVSGPDGASASHEIFNIGNSSPVKLLDFISTLGRVIGREPILNLLPMQPGDVPATFADTGPLERAVGFRPSTPLSVGLARFVEWYLEYHGREAV